MTGGTLVLTNGSSSNLRLGNHGGSGFVTMSNGLMKVVFLTVGGPGSAGTFAMAGGTNLVSDSVFVGDSLEATGTVWMTGGQLTVSNQSTALGDPGVGQMTVSNGTWAASTVSVRQGTLTIVGGQVANVERKVVR